MFGEDMDSFLDDFGVPCIKAASIFTGILDMPDQHFDMGGMTIQNTEYSLTYRVADTTLANGDAVTVSGIAYLVRGPAVKVDDGIFASAKLSKV
jgi:hypothetical protein